MYIFNKNDIISDKLWNNLNNIFSFVLNMSIIEHKNLTIETAKNFKKIIERLTDYEGEGITVYRGGPLDLRHNGIDESWLIPVIVKDEAGSTAFHIIQTCGGREDLQSSVFELNVASDLGLKLGDQDSSEVSNLKYTLLGNGESKRTIIRPSIAGNMAYPNISTPLNLADPKTILKRANRVADLFGSTLDYERCDLESLSEERFKTDIISKDFMFGKERTINSEVGIVFITPVIIKNDEWGYYEVISTKPLSEIDRNSTPIIRVDSGCDTGQCYHDGGCDCRSQLFNGLLNGQIIIAVSPQDGRGWGIIPKLATEGGKRGIPVGYNDGMPPMDTVEASEKLHGKKYDIRTYHGSGKLILELGFNKVALITDNKDKITDLESTGLTIERIPTNTQNDKNHNASHHVEAKLRTERYIL